MTQRHSQPNMRRQQQQQQQRKAQSSSQPSSLKCHPFPLTVPEDAATQHATQIVIAHRGASAHLPEHSIPGYRLALELGADYIEPDLVATKDRQLIAIHSMDMSLTTNVEDVFGEERKTASKFKNNELGYWTYDFTLEEIQQLRLKQRLPAARSTVFDGLFKIPTLSDILELLVEWNEKVQPQMYNLNGTKSAAAAAALSNNMNKLDYPPPPRGVYAELKDSPWLEEDTGMKLLDIFFEHFQQNAELWQRSMWQHMCDTKLLKQHEYRLPLLMLQAFQADVLKDFAKRWEELAKGSNGGGDGDSSEIALTASVPDPQDPSSMLTLPLPVPPTILLAAHDKCHKEDFWFDIEDHYREYVSGIGIDKRCFFILDDDEDDALVYSPTIMEKARKAGWAVHPWTERPEAEWFVKEDLSRRRQRLLQDGNSTDTFDDNSTDTLESLNVTLPPTILPPSPHTDPTNIIPDSEKPPSSPFTTVMEELMFFKCKVGIQGIFSESVDTAVRAFNMPCPGVDEGNNSGGSSGGSNSGGPVPAECSTNSSSSSSTGFLNASNVPLGPVILASFFLGILITLVIWRFTGGRRGRQVLTNQDIDQNGDGGAADGGIMMTKTRFGKQQHSAIATDDLTLTAEDREIL
ncbi:MAG: hypothetical protein SGILL_002877 [Bacillariaceae sp.]